MTSGAVALIQDHNALRAFERVCKGQGTEAAVKKLREETPELWRETVMRFRDTKQASSSGRVKFDTAKHLTVVRRSLTQEQDMEYLGPNMAVFIRSDTFDRKQHTGCYCFLSTTC